MKRKDGSVSQKLQRWNSPDNWGEFKEINSV
jgi:hypothetical protein